MAGSAVSMWARAAAAAAAGVGGDSPGRRVCWERGRGCCCRCRPRCVPMLAPPKGGYCQGCAGDVMRRNGGGRANGAAQGRSRTVSGPSCGAGAGHVPRCGIGYGPRSRLLEPAGQSCSESAVRSQQSAAPSPVAAQAPPSVLLAAARRGSLAHSDAPHGRAAGRTRRVSRRRLRHGRLSAAPRRSRTPTSNPRSTLWCRTHPPSVLAPGEGRRLVPL